MLGKNLRYYRLMAGLTQEALAQRVGLQKMAVCNYENNKRTPSGETLHSLCAALGISPSKLMGFCDGPVSITGGSFRKGDGLSVLQQEALLAQIENHVNRYAEAASFVGGLLAEIALPAEKIPLSASDGENAALLREALGLASSGPVGSLIQAIENAGIFAICMEGTPASFSGFSCWTNIGLPVVAVNAQMVSERQRFTVVHELVHLLFGAGEESLSEARVDSIAGRFLIPRGDIIRELGPGRKSLGAPELGIIREEYGASMQCVVVRAHQENIISSTLYASCFSSPLADSYSNPAKAPETPTRLKQVVCRAFAEGEIGLGKAAELLAVPVVVARDMFGLEVASAW